MGCWRDSGDDGVLTEATPIDTFCVGMRDMTGRFERWLAVSTGM